jgi:acetolactate synthase I/II/III large subunit
MDGATLATKILQRNKISRVFSVVGGSAMGLNRAFANNKYFEITYNHNEQASAIAAEAYALRYNKPACVCVSSGPGATNSITGVLCSYMGSTPMIIISGQVRFKTTTRGSKIKVRSLGEQEANISEIVRPITKYSDMITNSNHIVSKITKSISLSKNGRPGPCWVDFPLDLQIKKINNFTKIPQIKLNKKKISKLSSSKLDILTRRLINAKKPLIIAGSGIRLSDSKKIFLKIIKDFKIPVVTSISGVDILSYNHPNLVGKIGITGDRPGNLIVQNCDLILAVGTRLSYKVTGFNSKAWASKAYKIMVDIDPQELNRKNLDLDLKLNMDVNLFLMELRNNLDKISFKKHLNINKNWLAKCKIVQKSLPIISDKTIKKTNKVNIYYFFNKLSNYLKKNSIVVATAGMSRVVGAQSLMLKKGARFIVNLTTAPMGYCLPGILGVKKNSKELITCVTGDGSFQMNIQELQTIIHEKIFVKIFILNNNGYHSIRQTQKNFFK